MVGLGKWSKDLEFKNFEGIVSQSYFKLVAWTHSRLPDNFLTQIFLQSVVLEKEYMKLNIGKAVDKMTRGSCILTDS